MFGPAAEVQFELFPGNPNKADPNKDFPGLAAAKQLKDSIPMKTISGNFEILLNICFLEQSFEIPGNRIHGRTDPDNAVFP